MSLMYVALASALACQPVVDKKLLGLWESVAISSGGIGSNIELRKDGSFTTAVTVLVDLKYQVKDGKLYIAEDSNKPVSFDTGLDISYEKNALLIHGKDGSKEIKYRVTPLKKDSIIGIYKYRHYTGGMAFERYTSDGMLNFRLPMKSTSGCFVKAKKQLKLKTPDGKMEAISYGISEGKLILGGKDNKSMYSRVVDGAWYDSKKIDFKKPK
jgi:hypothetical protein